MCATILCGVWVDRTGASNHVLSPSPMLSAALLATVAGARADSAPLLPYGVVDCHVHMATPTNGITYGWAKDPASLDPPEQCPCRPPCACNMTIPEYMVASSAWEVSDIVFCEVSANQEDWLKEARWVQSLADGPFKATKTRVGAIMAQPPPGFVRPHAPPSPS